MTWFHSIFMCYPNLMNPIFYLQNIQWVGATPTNLTRRGIWEYHTATNLRCHTDRLVHKFLIPSIHSFSLCLPIRAFSLSFPSHPSLFFPHLKVSALFAVRCLSFCQNKNIKNSNYCINFKTRRYLDKNDKIRYRVNNENKIYYHDNRKDILRE